MATKKILGKTTGATKKTAAARKSKEAISQAKDASDPGQRLIVHGTVFYRDTSPAIGLTVIAFDKDIGGEDRLGQATTDAIGGYRITYSAAEFRRSPNESGGADVFVRVYGANGDLLYSSKTVRNAPEDLLLDVQLPGAQLVVRGQVRLADGSPLAGVLVRAYDKDLRSEQRLGEPATTDKDGRYEIGYTAAQFARAEKQSADLVVRVDNLGGGEPTASRIIFNARPEEIVPLVVSGQSTRPSEYERLARELEPLLDGTSVTKLEDRDAEFLAGETGRELEMWRAFVRAQQLVVNVGTKIPAEAFYAWLRAGLPSEWEALVERPITEMRTALTDGVAKNIVAAWVDERIDEILAQVPNAARDELGRLLDVAVPPEVARRIFGRVDVNLTDRHVDELVDAKTLEPREATRLGLAVSLHRLVGGDGPDTVAKVLGVLGDDVDAAPQLAALSPAAWAQTLERAGAPIPPGVTRLAQGREIALNVAAAFPERAFRSRVLVPEKIDGEAQRFLVNAHPGLALGEVFEKHRGAEAHKIVRERIGWLEHVFAKNPDLELLGVDYLSGSPSLAQVDFGELSEVARAHVVADLQAAQRVHAVTGNAYAAYELRANGLSSATAISNVSVQQLVELTGIAHQEATSYHATALQIVHDSAVLWFGIHEIARDNSTTPVRAIPTRAQFFRQLPAYTQLIADQPWCACEHCHSVLGPAAYFVDLMFFVERHISAFSLAGRETHPLHLQVRRPDLWDDVELSCAHTNDRIPHLDLVNEMLEKYLVAVEPATFANAAAIYNVLAGGEKSFAQPFTWPLVRLTTLLSHFGVTRFAVASAMNAGTTMRARARLNLSAKAAELITTPLPSASLVALYRITTNVTALDVPLPAAEMATLLTATRLDHATLSAALSSDFLRRDGTTVPRVSIVLGKRDPSDVQNNSEVVNNLTLRRLDRLHRFTRLWRTLPWTVAELDAVLLHFAPTVPAIEAATNTAAGTLERILKLLEADTWGLAVDELLAVAGTFSSQPLRGETAALFDRLFNAPTFATDGVWPPAATRFTHPSWTRRLVTGQPRTPAGRASPNDSSLARLRAGLQLADDELVALIDGLGSIAAIDRRPATLLADESIALSLDAIATLYRHARVRRAIGCSIADFLELLAIAPIASVAGEPPAIRTLADARAVIELAAWQRTSSWTFAELRHLLDPTSLAPRDPKPIAAALVRDVADENALAFADTLFVGLGLTEEQSRALVAANVTQTMNDTRPFEASGQSYRIRSIGVAGFAIPQILGALVDRTAALAALAPFEALRIFDVQIGNALGHAPDQVRALRAIAAPQLDAAAIARALHENPSTGDTTQLQTLVGGVLRFETLLGRLDVTGMRFASTSPDVLFGAAGPLVAPPTITLAVLRNVVGYAALATMSDAGFTTASEEPDIAALHRVVENVGSASDLDIATVLDRDESSVAALRSHVLLLQANAFAALATLDRCLDLAAQLGVSAETLARIVDDAPTSALTNWGSAADDVVAAFRAKYDASVFAEKMEPFEDVLRSRKRDGLVDYVMSRWPIYSSIEKVSEYFLIDVAMGGCARTSRIVAATGSLRIYVQRVLMNLERSDDGTVFARLDPTKHIEWTWRRHYRVWEANRRVFLYPENYLEPELRDDKTPLFEDLEDELLAREIDTASVNDAYSRYLTGFDEASRLRIAGAYYEAGTTIAPVRKLHVFGVTDDDAPIYYYRQVQETGPVNDPSQTFSAWKRLELQIPVRAVTPIVFEGRLYVFWLETMTRPQTKIKDGESIFTGYRHLVRVRFSFLRTDGVWSSPHLVRFVENGGSSDSRIVEDPRDLAPLQQLQSLIAEQEALLKETEPLGVLALGVKVSRDARDRAEGDFNTKSEALRIIELTLPPFPPGMSKDDGIFFIAAANPGSAIAWGITRRFQIGSQFNLIAMQIAFNSAEAAQRRARNELARLKLLTAITRVRWDARGRNHFEPIESYRPEGWQWERVYADVTTTVPRQLRITLVPNGDRDATAVGIPGELDISTGELHTLPVTELPSDDTSRDVMWSNGALWSASLTDKLYAGQDHYAAAVRLGRSPTTASSIKLAAAAPATADVHAIGCAPQTSHVIMQTRGDSAWMRPQGDAHLGIRLASSLTRSLGQVFARSGLDGLLEPAFQRSLKEKPSAISPLRGQSDPKRSPFDDSNAFSTYYDETFFHIPFLVADHLNSQAKHSAAQRWFHYLFDPTAADGEPWRARELRETSPIFESLRSQLANPAALAAYRSDPFNPHAIARTRPNAYHKAIVMKYVDNLLDWGDALFEQFTMESLDEATMLYVMAQDILGPRPRVLGSCGEDKTRNTYREISKGFGVGNVLVELEAVATPPSRYTPVKWVVPATQPRMVTKSYAITAGPQFDGGGPEFGEPMFEGSAPTPLTNGIKPITVWTSNTGTKLNVVGTNTTGPIVVGTGGTTTGPIPGNIGGNIDFVRDADLGGIGIGGHTLSPAGDLGRKYGIDELDIKYGLHDVDRPIKVVGGRVPRPVHLDPVEMIPTKPVFCIPPNKDLLAFWDRVESRLFNIRNCRDISGVRRRPDLFAPEIDPRLLVRLTAAGLSIDEVLSATSGNLPPYRFTYLVEKAKQHASTVQSFGAQLLAALEKHDAEELSRLRTVHEQNLLVMRRKVSELEIRAAEDSIETLRRQREAVDYRRQHFASLREVGQLDGERKQQQLQGDASQFRSAAGIAQVVASILTVIPDMGAWTAMKFGGSQLGAAGRAVADSFNALAGLNEMGAARAGVEASNQRRDQEWLHQTQSAQLELAQLDRSIAAAEFRRDIAVHSLSVHERTVAQSEEMFELVRDKFSNVDRYRLLSKELRRLYRLAFKSALAMARMAEQAFRAERPDDEIALVGGYWDTATSGLLAGERLTIDLQQLERQFIERNHRELEVEHAFSLAQFAPDALASLRLTGSCRFSIPEWFFDLTYPGQYRRRVKGVRVTIPCIVGPHGNVGATLRLESSEIRRIPATGPVPVPSRHTTSIATSRAQNDVGVFDFSFRDERYMPFEGAGAISTWTLSLPGTLRTFDYATISDLVLSLDYTALYDTGLNERWDGLARELLAMLASSTAPALVHIVSLRSDFPDVFHRLVSSPPNTEVGFSLESRHFPAFVQKRGRSLVATGAGLAVIAAADTLPTTTVSIGRKASTPATQTFKPVTATAGTDGGELREFNLGSVFDPTGVTAAILDNYVIKLTTGADPRALRDITLRIVYRIGP